jgi:hypothetical protein
MASKKEATERPIALVWLDPDEAQLNPDNWRIHQQLQLDSLEALIFDDGHEGGGGAVGWAGAALVNDRQVEDGWTEEDAVPTLVDGHARQKIAAERGEKMPAIIGRWTPDQEALVLATLDPLSLMAGRDRGMLEIVRFDAVTENDVLRNLLGKDAASKALGETVVEAAKRDEYMLAVGRHQVPLTELEIDLLCIEADTYVSEMGLAHGFVRHLLAQLPPLESGEEEE